MKLFITGATGFIGQHLVKKLASEGHDVTINLRGTNPSLFEKEIKFYCLEINWIETDIDFLKREAFDGVIHLASLYLTSHKPNEAIKLVDSNVRFSTYILECSVQAGIKWFINTGTFWQNYQNSNYSPVNLYAATKQAFESIAQFYIETNQIKFSTIKLCDTFGPNDFRPKLFSLWQRIAKTGETLDMSPGEQIIDISFIEDVLTAFALLAKHLQNDSSKIVNGAVYAVKAKERLTLKRLSEIFEKATNQKLDINWGAKPYRAREVMIPWEDGETVPEWEPAVSIEEGIKQLNLGTQA